VSSSTVVLSENEAKETDSITLQERLKRNVSFSVVTNINNGEEAISFRGLDFKSTEYVEDGIPLYRSTNGFIDTKFTMTDAELQINDGSETSSLGVSPMGGVVQIDSKKPVKALESQLNTSISNNDEYYHAYTGSMLDNVYIKADASYYHRSDYTLSDDYVSTPLQEKGKRLNSDKDQRNISLKSGIFIDDQLHLAGKLSLTRAEYGIPPNVYTDLVDPVWDAYSRIKSKDLKSYYLYADYDRDDLEISIRAYYDDYEDVFKIYDDPDYQSSWPEVNYNDHRLGTVIKGIKTQDNHKSTFIVQAEENEHIRSYTLMQAKEAADASATEPSEDKKTFDAQVKITYTNEQSVMYGSIANKSRMPTMSEMFTFFPWRNAYQHELEEKTTIDLSLYYYDVSDLIIYRDSGYINREEAEHYGAEIRVNSTYFDHNNVRFSYAYAHTKDSKGGLSIYRLQIQS
jgi:iron complex outermembrane receptor protein